MTEQTQPTLLEVVNATPAKRKEIVSDSVGVLEEEVRSKKGFSGTAIKLAFGTVKRLKPSILEDLIDMLFDEFVLELEPFYQAYLAQDEESRGTFSSYLNDRSAEVADALLNVTDKRRQRAQNKLLIKTYDKLRPSALSHVKDGVPAVGRLMQRHAF